MSGEIFGLLRPWKDDDPAGDPVVASQARMVGCTAWASSSCTVYPQKCRWRQDDVHD
jgi:hypothetical protein